MLTFISRCCFPKLLLLVAVPLWPYVGVCGEQVALVEVFLHPKHDVSASVLQGEVLQGSLDGDLAEKEKDHDMQGDLRIIQNEDEGNDIRREHAQASSHSPWIGLVSVSMDESAVSTGNPESFAAAVVNKMKRALVLGASALIILVLNQNTVREMDLSEVLSKPVIIMQTSENVTKLIGALLRGLQATAKITYRTFLQNNLGATLTLWSSCGRSRGGVYGEWQGVICTGETNSPVQKYLQQLWDTVVLAALILSTGVIVQAHWQYQGNQFNDDLEVNSHTHRSHSKRALRKRLSVLQTRTYRPPKAWSDADSCAVCLEQYSNNQCLRVLPCLHEFHRDCVDPWLLMQQTCPLCKRSVLGNFC